jgi:hypothetical protein
LRPKGTIWTNFRNNGITVTSSGHAAIVSGRWQDIDNHGKQHPLVPTVFEYFRKYTGADEKSVAVIAGAPKLNVLAFSTDSGYGSRYKASFCLGENVKSTVNNFKEFLSINHPRITLVQLWNVDNNGHSGKWEKYICAIRTADSLVYEIWKTLESDSVYRGNTTMFVLNDHGRHDKLHGDFKNHGDGCEGCRHLMMLAIGRGFPGGMSIDRERTQCDIAPTVGELLSFSTEQAKGTSLLHDTDMQK